MSKDSDSYFSQPFSPFLLVSHNFPTEDVKIYSFTHLFVLDVGNKLQFRDEAYWRLKFLAEGLTVEIRKKCLCSQVT